MPYYFQPPIFPLYLVPGVGPIPLIPGTYIPYLAAPLRILPALPAGIPLLRIRIKVIFHRDGGALASNDLAYEGPQSREALLGHLAWWSGVHGLGGRVYSGQATLYLTSILSTMSIFPGVGPVTPEHTLRVVSLAEQLPAREFEAMMLDIINGPLGAFLVVDVGAFDRFHGREPPLQRQHLPEAGVDASSPPLDPNPSTSPPPPDQPPEPSNDLPPSSPKTGGENAQTSEPDISKWDSQDNGNDEPEPESGGTANG